MDDGASKSPPAAELALALLSFAALSAWWLWPLPTAALTALLYEAEIPFQHADIDLHVWSLAWVAHALVTSPASVFDANSFYPAPLTLAYSEHLLGLAPVFAPIYLATSNPVLAANVVVFALHVLAAAGMYVLARRFVAAPAAWVAAAMFAFYPQRVDDLTNFYLLATGLVPLAIFFTERWLDEARTRDVVGVAVCVGLALLCSFYLAYGVALAYGVYLVVRMVSASRALDGRRTRGLLAALAAAAVPFLVSSVPYVVLRQAGAIPEYAVQSAQTLGLNRWITMERTWRFLTGYGIPLAAWPFALLGLWPLSRRVAWASRVGVALALVGLAISLGPTAHVGPIPTGWLYTALQEWVPGFSSMRLSLRFLWVVQLGGALLVAVGLHRALAWLPRGRWVGAVAAAAALYLSYAALPEARLHERQVGAGVSEAYRWLAANGQGRPLLELPVAPGEVRSRRMLASHAHWLPLLQGYSAYPTPALRYLRRFAVGLPSGHALDGLTEAVDVGWVLVHLDELAAARAGHWRAELPPGLEVAARFDDDLVVRVTDTRVRDAREHLFGGDATLGGVPLRAFDGSCAGAIELETPLEARVGPGAALPLRVALRNEGESPWPGLAFASPHVVQLAACVGQTGWGCAEKTIPLLADVAPGETVRVSLLARVPSVEGDYELRIRLFQPSGHELSECGVAALIVPLTVGPPPAS